MAQTQNVVWARVRHVENSHEAEGFRHGSSFTIREVRVAHASGIRLNRSVGSTVRAGIGYCRRRRSIPFVRRPDDGVCTPQWRRGERRRFAGIARPLRDLAWPKWAGAVPTSSGRCAYSVPGRPRGVVAAGGTT